MIAAELDWAALHTALEQADWARAEAWWQAVSTVDPASAEQAAALALRLGRPRLATRWTREPLTSAAAWLRLGHPDEVQAALGADPGPAGADLTPPASARRSVLLARAAWQRALLDPTALGDPTPQATAARQQARQEGDAGAIVAAAVLLAEIQLWGADPDPKLALRTLAEGLKVAELTGQPADAALLAALSHVQAQVGSAAKAQRSAAKALARSEARSPARVLALLALGQPAEAQAQASAGELAPLWWQVWSGQGP